MRTVRVSSVRKKSQQTLALSVTGKMLNLEVSVGQLGDVSQQPAALWVWTSARACCSPGHPNIWGLQGKAEPSCLCSLMAIKERSWEAGRVIKVEWQIEGHSRASEHPPSHSPAPAAWAGYQRRR